MVGEYGTCDQGSDSVVASRDIFLEANAAVLQPMGCWHAFEVRDKPALTHEEVS
jgi:hypothetical protein